MIPAAIGGIAVGPLLGLLGSVGSIATFPILVYLVKLPEKSAIASSLLIVGGIAVSGALRYTLRVQVDLRAVLRFGLSGMVGSYLGAMLARGMDASTQMTLFAAVMGIAAVGMLTRKDPDDNVETAKPGVKLAAAGLCVGVLTGVVGVGGGFLIVQALVPARAHAHSSRDWDEPLDHHAVPGARWPAIARGHVAVAAHSAGGTTQDVRLVRAGDGRSNRVRERVGALCAAATGQVLLLPRLAGGQEISTSCTGT